MTRWRVGSSLALVGLAVLGCTPTPAMPEVEAIEVEALREAFANPTAPVTEANAIAVADEVIAKQAVYEVVADYLGRVFESEGEAVEGHVVLAQTSDPDTATVYLLFACPGDSLDNEDVGFAFGTMRLDAEALTPNVTQAAAFTGHGSIAFDKCQLEDLELDGDAPIYRDPETEEMLVDPTIDFVEVDGLIGTQSLRALDNALQFLPNDQTNVLYTVADGTLVLESDSLADEVRLRGTNGSLVCSVGEGEAFGCEPP